MAMAIPSLLEQNGDTVIVLQMPRGWLLVALYSLPKEEKLLEQGRVLGCAACIQGSGQGEKQGSQNVLSAPAAVPAELPA